MRFRAKRFCDSYLHNQPVEGRSENATAAESFIAPCDSSLKICRALLTVDVNLYSLLYSTLHKLTISYVQQKLIINELLTSARLLNDILIASSNRMIHK
jgi:hypothetical protein